MDIPIRASIYCSAVSLICSQSSASSSYSSSFRIYCSRKNPGSPQRNDDDNKDNKGNKEGSMDWDKAWSNFKKQGKKSLTSQFNPDKFVSWNPRRSNYPLSEEVDPIKRTERSNLMLWTSPQFTLGLAIVIITLLLIYTVLAPTR